MTSVGVANLPMADPNHGLLVLAHERRDGFWASIRGKAFDLADPSSEAFAPTPDDLFIASIASGLAWSTRRLLRDHGISDRVSVEATWQKDAKEQPLTDVTMTVTVPRDAEAEAAALSAFFAESVAARTRVQPAVHVSFG